ncbi:hypothetical protein PLICRDRAFT_86263 [Plicaturopsis crispa FD-325 SS-3]|nr:hypothetical protein PLICRDRAFT_86263 [Plicaturopsis crispa FD-325 SS-3]
MSYRLNNACTIHILPFSAPGPMVKPEPQEAKITPLSASNSWRAANDDAPIVKPDVHADAARVFLERGLPVPEYVSKNAASSSSTAMGNGNVKPEPMDAQMQVDAQEEQEQQAEKAPALYPVFESAADIQYAPEEALKVGLSMVKTIKSNIKKLELGSKLRKDVWLREIESLQNQGAPTTMIAVCGATGAGKSSILNAILDDNIVPTSGMRACTAVVTEIAYHSKKTIDADVSFLSEDEWKQELEVLLDDLIDEDGRLKRATDLKSDAGVAWQKVHAVYPSISQEQLVGMTVEQIVARDPKIARILGATKNIVAKDSKTFALEIGKYIDSKDQKRGDKKDKDKKKHKDKDARQPKNNHNNDERSQSALWPLIRQVSVRCPSPCLSTGVILVDLPGVADANAARNSIAKDYMKKCDCIWILAPITRAVDDKTAKDLLGDAFKMQLMMDGNYDDTAITFIASKCDDISCSEVIRALHLEDDPDLEEIEERIEQYADETQEWKAKKSDTEKVIKALDGTLKETREYLREYEEHLRALEAGEPFVPRLTAKNKTAGKTNGKKRKNSSGGKGGSPKRRKSDGGDGFGGDDDEDMDDDVEVISDDDSDSEDGSDKDSDEEGSKSGSDSDSESDEGEDEEEEGEVEVTPDDLKAKIDDAKLTIKATREKLNEVRKQKKEAIDNLATLRKKEHKAQKEKNAFCSLKRSEFSRDVLKEDFRVGLKELDDANAEERNPDEFDPTVNLRNYDDIDLPVFTCSSRDYVRLKHQVKGDGDPTCFSNVEDTGIPALQQWCHQLTIASRERSARNFLSHLKTFADSVRNYVQGIGDVTVADREALREKWESSEQNDADDADDGFGAGWASSDPFDIPDLAGFGGGLYSMEKKPAPVKVDPYGEPVGVTPRLTKEFVKVIDSSVAQLQERFKDGLEEKCRIGAANASEAAVATSDTFAASMHWGTYRATLRRHGSWRRDLNVELTNPFTRNIAHTWSKVFEADLFADFDRSAVSAINKLLKEVEDSAAPGLKDRARLQAESCVAEARVALKKTLEVVRETLNNEQKEVSRCLAPHVQDHLREGYNRAMEERGTGSVARQKALFHNYVNDCKDEVFNGGAEVLLGRLAGAAEAVGDALETALTELAQKIEVNLAVLWEGPRDDPAQVKARAQIVESVSEIISQTEMWTTAEQSRMQDVESSNP